MQASDSMNRSTIASRAEALKCIGKHAAKLKSFHWQGHLYQHERIELFLQLTSLTRLTCELTEAENFEDFGCLKSIQQYTVVVPVLSHVTVQLLLNDGGASGKFSSNATEGRTPSSWFHQLHKLVNDLALDVCHCQLGGLELLLEEVMDGSDDDNPPSSLTRGADLERVRVLYKHCQGSAYYLCAQSYTANDTLGKENIHIIRRNAEMTST